MLDLAHSKSRDILDFYQESNTKRTQELTTLTTENALDLTPFYAHLQQLRQHHRPASSNAPASLSLATPIQEVIPVRKGSSESLDKLFSGEEHFGKYLDCNSLYTQYCNLKNVVPRDYLSFIDLLDNFDHISEWLKKEKTYLEYLKAVQTYLLDFYRRARPLYNTEELLTLSERKVKRRFDDLQNDLLYCKNCEKRFVKETVFKAHLTGKKHLEATKHHVEPANRPVTDSVLLLESNIRELYGPLKAIKNATIANIERKQSLTVEELALEEEEEEFDELEVLQEGLDETEETDKLYNPLKLPLGWDGKPIPYWLYKLHGLSVSYTCEICGNYTYMGRKAFEKHFQVIFSLFLFFL